MTQVAAMSSLGMDLRARTLLKKAQILGHFLQLLAQTKQITFSMSEEHLLDFLQLRLQEPCTRNAVKGLHESFMYLETVADIVPKDRLTTSFPSIAE